MEKTVEEQKKMVYEILLESKEPLMAKKIAYNIYKKYNGYRMSRFIVRDILWNEMKGLFEYDRDNYTYTLNNHNLNNNSIKEIKDLNYFIKPFERDSPELLYPLLYKEFPNRNSLKNKIESIVKYLINETPNIDEIPPEEVLVELQLIFEKGLNSFKHDAFFYKLILIYKKKRKQKLDNSFVIQKLKIQLENPFKTYFKLTNFNSEHISFHEESTAFDKIVKEVCRDNIITDNEKAYLFEKASEYFIDLEKLKRYLDNPFFGHETFKIFIDQICEDLIITDVERHYIREKAVQYNVSLDQMDKMIEIGLERASFHKTLSNSPIFYEIIIIYLISNTLKIKSIEDIVLEGINSQKRPSLDEISQLHDFAINELKIELNNQYYIGEWSDLTELLEKLNISILSFDKALKAYNNKNNQQTKYSINQDVFSLGTKQEKLLIDSLKIEDLEITKSNNLVRPFDIKFFGSKICIEYRDEIDEIILVKAITVFYLKNSKSISKTNIIKQLNRILEQLLNEQN